MYLFKFLGRSIGLTIPVMLRMLPVVGITFFLVGAVFYALSPYPLAVGILAVIFAWPLMMLLGISFVRAALSQMKETTAPDLGKLLRMVLKLSAFHIGIFALFTLLTWFVTASLVPENWMDETSERLKNAGLVESRSSRGPINLPTIQKPSLNKGGGPFQSASDLSKINPGGVERREADPRPRDRSESTRTAPPRPEPVTEPEIQEEISSVTVEGDAVVSPTIGSFFDYVFNGYRPLIIGYFAVQGLYWLVLAALAVPFGAQAATVAARGPAHEFLWGTGKKTVYVFILMVISNAIHFIGFLAITYLLGTSLSLAFQELEQSTDSVSAIMQSGGFYFGALTLLSYLTYSLMAAGTAVAYVDSRADMQRKKDIEMGRILASVEQGPDIRALIRERSKGTALAKGTPVETSKDDAEIAESKLAASIGDRPAIRPATPQDDVEEDFVPMIMSKLNEVDEPDIDAEGSGSDVLSLQTEDLTKKPPLKLEPEADAASTQEPESDEPKEEDYDEDWFLKPLPSEVPVEEEAPKEEVPVTVEKAEEDDEEDIEWIRNLFKEEEGK